MPFILQTNTLFKLDFLRAEYQKERQVDLDKTPSFFGMPTFLGGTDVANRRRQIDFLAKMRVVLNANLLKEENIKNPVEWEANLMASRAMIAACLYVQTQIGRSTTNSALYRLIDADLGIFADNLMDDEDKELCFLAAQHLICDSMSKIREANVALRAAGMKPFSEIEWAAFRKFLLEVDIKKVTKNPYAEYPVTSLTKPLFGAVFGCMGATIGLTAGDVLSRSAQTMSAKTQLTAYVGGTLLVFGSAGPAGVALFAPLIVERLVSTFCSISLAYILGTSMKVVGQGVGIGVGMSLDMVYRLLWSTCAMIINACSKQPKIPQITGTRISDGATVISGVAITAKTVDESVPKIHVDLKEGELYINDKLVESGTTIDLPPELLEQLKDKLKGALKKSDFVLVEKEDAVEATASVSAL